MLSVLVPPAASYMYYMPMVPTRSPWRFDSFASPFDSMFDHLLHTSRAFGSFGPGLLDAPRHSQLASLTHAFDLLDVPTARQPRWVEKDDALELAFHVQPYAKLSVEVVEGSLQLKATAGQEGAAQRSTSYSVSLPFELKDPRAIEVFRDTDGARLTLRVPKSAAVKPPEPERIQLEIKASTPALGAPTVAKQPEHAKSDEAAADEKFAFAHKEEAQAAEVETSPRSTEDGVASACVQ
jgi:hypothetical protein